MIKDVYKYSFDAIGTHWWIKIYDKNKTDLNLLLEEIKNLSLKFELDFSRFIETSYISKLNNLGYLNDFPYEFFEIISQAELGRIKSLGSFNLGVASILDSIGYDKDYSFESKIAENQVNLDFNTSPFEDLSENNIVLKPNFKVELGGIGKGFLIDKIANKLLEAGIKYFSINGGGDIYMTSDHGENLEFVLEHPLDPKLSIGQVSASNLGLACSAPNRRLWQDRISGKLKHHLIDLEEKDSKGGVLAVFTQAKTALMADIGSTALFVCKRENIKTIAKNF